MPNYRYTFISHAHADNALCDPFAEAFVRLKIPHYYDREAPQHGILLPFFLQDKILESRALVVLVTPASQASEWVRLEIAMFHFLKSREPYRKLIWVRIVDCPVEPLLAAYLGIDAVGQPFDAVIASLASALEETTAQEAFDSKSTPETAPPNIPTLLDQITKLQMELDSKSRNAEKNERLIRQLRTELRRDQMDLISLYDDLQDIIAKNALPNDSPMKRSLMAFEAGIIETLNRNGVEAYQVEGDAFDRERQRQLQAVPTPDPVQDVTIARRVRIGFRTAERILRQELVDVYHYQPQQ